MKKTEKTAKMKADVEDEDRRESRRDERSQDQKTGDHADRKLKA